MIASDAAARNRWLTCPLPAPGAPWRLYCLPHAGGGVSGYAPWASELAPDIEVTAICPPGRERHLAGRPHRAMAPLVSELAAVLSPRLQAPYAFFGHSLGALVAFELARLLWRRGAGPAHLLVSACRPPQHPPHLPPDMPRPLPRLHEMDDETLLSILSRDGGISADLSSEPAVLELVMPALRADLEIAAQYRISPGEQLPCSITAFGGLADRGVQPDTLDGWGAVTTGRFTRRLLPGNHFYLMPQRQAVLDTIRRDLAAHEPEEQIPDMDQRHKEDRSC